ncbi:hypothetical protein [Arundinibacter roseus]|uniref:Phage major capsid protein n=1 Tax=Arundinibacter roseus TaxID=2070510 RepID=A0A4R4KL77_9BACT|nr:hypothetical protein [Arundinibacter roseus]TDB69094.1 hypothetical protein EZE20_01800 [Arundinibacter roseus]
MSNVVDVSALRTELTKDTKDFGKIFGLKLADGWAAKADFVRLGINEEVSLVRDELGNLTQPGRTGSTNFTNTFLKQKERIGKLKPAKVDLKLTEDELYKLRLSYLGRREPGNPRDINSLPGRTYLMNRVMAGIGKEINRAIFKGVENRTTGVQGGINLFDGLDFKLTAGYTTVALGGVEDIPAGNKVASPAASVTEANILGELKKMVSLIYESEDLIEYKDEDASLLIPPIWYQFMVNALDSALSNGSQVVSKKGDNYVFNLLPNTVIKPRTYMIGVDNMVWTLNGNLFWLHQDVDVDIPRIKFQEQDRDLKILIDFELNVDYADGRVIVLYK